MYAYDADADVWSEASAFYTVRMFEPIWLYQEGENTGARGTVEISRFYYDGSQIIMDSSIYASNPTNNPEAQDPENYPLSVLPWFRTNQFTGPNGDEIHPEHRDTKPIEIIEVGERSLNYYPGPLTDPDPVTGERKPFDRDVGTMREGDGKAFYFLAHTHLQVFDNRKPADNWEVDTGVLEFTWKDGP